MLSACDISALITALHNQIPRQLYQLLISQSALVTGADDVRPG